MTRWPYISKTNPDKEIDKVLMHCAKKGPNWLTVILIMVLAFSFGFITIKTILKLKGF